jgi:hypothetical protein
MLFVALCLSGAAWAQTASAPKEDTATLPAALVQRGKTLEGLKEDISLLNLLNGLNLTGEQMRAILLHVKALRSLLLVKACPEILEDTEKAFRRLKETLMKNQGIPKEVRARVHTAEGRVKKLQELFREVIAYREKEVRKILLPSQVEIIETFSPCTFPPETLSNPVRVGEAGRGETAKVEEALLKVHRMSDSEFEEKRGKIEQSIREALSKKIFTDRIEGELSRIMGIVEKARRLSETDLALQKSVLAREMIPKDLAKDLSLRLNRFHRRLYGGRTAVAKTMFNFRIIPLLEGRLAQMEAFRPAPSKDLAKLRGAGTCKDGKCGKKYGD